MTFIGHGLTPDTRAALRDGTMDVAITQDHQIMVLNCVRIFTNLRDGRAALSGIEPIQISLFVRENLSGLSVRARALSLRERCEKAWP